MKKILATVTLLLLFTLTTSNASATTVHFPSNKVHIPHHTISNKNNNKVQETKSEVETTTTHANEHSASQVVNDTPGFLQKEITLLVTIVLGLLMFYVIFRFMVEFFIVV